MATDLPLRVWMALAIVAVAGAVVLVLGSPAEAAIASCFGLVAVLLAGWPEAAAAPPPVPPPPEDGDGEDIVDALSEPLLVLEDARVTHANRAARRLLGDHVVGEDVRTAIRHPAAAERLAAPMAGDADGADVDLVGLGNVESRWRMRIAPLSGTRRIVHLADQTGSYAAERMRVDFVANASHELRTPLASILGYVETLGEGAGEDPETRARFLRIVFDEARRMQQLVEDLMSLSRIEAEKYRLPAETVNLPALIAQVSAEIGKIRGAQDRIVLIPPDGPVAPIHGDRAQISQMLHNLIGNALKYGSADTPVDVAVARDGSRMVRLTITDRGEGIAPEHLPRLTERFYRVDAGRSRSLGGTGLGLAIVKHIVERHRGRLDIASRLGEGTRVSVSLPVAQPVAMPVTALASDVIKA